MRPVIELDGHPKLARTRVAENEVHMLPRNQMPEAGLPRLVGAGDEVGQSHLGGDEKSLAHGHAKHAVERQLSA